MVFVTAGYDEAQESYELMYVCTLLILIPDLTIFIPLHNKLKKPSMNYVKHAKCIAYFLQLFIIYNLCMYYQACGIFYVKQ